MTLWEIKVIYQILGAGTLSGMWDFPLWYAILYSEVTTSDPFLQEFLSALEVHCVLTTISVFPFCIILQRVELADTLPAGSSHRERAGEITPGEQGQQKAPTGTWSLAEPRRPRAGWASTASPNEQASHHIDDGSVIHRIFSQNVNIPYQFFNHEISAVFIEVYRFWT